MTELPTTKFLFFHFFSQPKFRTVVISSIHQKQIFLTFNQEWIWLPQWSHSKHDRQKKLSRLIRFSRFFRFCHIFHFQDWISFHFFGTFLSLGDETCFFVAADEDASTVLCFALLCVALLCFALLGSFLAFHIQIWDRFSDKMKLFKHHFNHKSQVSGNWKSWSAATAAAAKTFCRPSFRAAVKMPTGCHFERNRLSQLLSAQNYPNYQAQKLNLGNRRSIMLLLIISPTTFNLIILIIASLTPVLFFHFSMTWSKLNVNR